MTKPDTTDTCFFTGDWTPFTDKTSFLDYCERLWLSAVENGDALVRVAVSQNYIGFLLTDAFGVKRLNELSEDWRRKSEQIAYMLAYYAKEKDLLSTEDLYSGINLLLKDRNPFLNKDFLAVLNAAADKKNYPLSHAIERESTRILLEEQEQKIKALEREVKQLPQIILATGKLLLLDFSHRLDKRLLASDSPIEYLATEFQLPLELARKIWQLFLEYR